MNDMKHISEEAFLEFKRNTMNQKDMETFLEHIASCDYCAALFASCMSEELISAPIDLKANILRAAKRPDILLPVRVKQTTKRMQLFLYSLKVGTATAAALALLLLSVNLSDFSMQSDKQPDGSLSEAAMQKEANIPLTTVIRDGMDSVCNDILNFSNTIMKTEVTKNDQKKK